MQICWFIDSVFIILGCGKVTNWRYIWTFGNNIMISGYLRDNHNGRWKLNLWDLLDLIFKPWDEAEYSLHVAKPPASLGLEPSYVRLSMCCQTLDIVVCCVCSSQISLCHETISWKLLSLSRMICVSIASPMDAASCPPFLFIANRRNDPVYPCGALLSSIHLGGFLKLGDPQNWFQY